MFAFHSDLTHTCILYIHTYTHTVQTYIHTYKLVVCYLRYVNLNIRCCVFQVEDDIRFSASDFTDKEIMTCVKCLIYTDLHIYNHFSFFFLTCNSYTKQEITIVVTYTIKSVYFHHGNRQQMFSLFTVKLFLFSF